MTTDFFKKEEQEEKESWGQFVELEVPYIPIQQQLITIIEKEKQTQMIRIWIDIPFLAKKEYFIKKIACIHLFIQCIFSILLLFLLIFLYS